MKKTFTPGVIAWIKVLSANISPSQQLTPASLRMVTATSGYLEINSGMANLPVGKSRLRPLSQI
jgi:hypothetical protein